METANQWYEFESSALLPDLHGKSEILEQKHVKELSSHMPARAEGYSWSLAFTTSTMGYSLPSLYRSLSRYEGPVLLIIKDSEGNIFGAFSSCSLKPSESFYGTGETYLFSFKQEINHATSSSETSSSSPSSMATAATSADTTNIIKHSNNENNQCNISNNNNSIVMDPFVFNRFTWTGDNMYFIKGNTDSLAFGAGDGNFGLWLDEDLYHGSTHNCKTFNNKPLTNHQDFVVCILECWCFL